MDNTIPQEVEIIIIGAGFSGLGMGAALLRQGRQDFVILERNGSVGGTWYENSYPGCRCDVQSNLYSLSFAPNPHWSRTYSPQGELGKYLEQVAIDHGLQPYIHLGCTVEVARWDESSQRWHLQTNQGLLKARWLIAAHGGMSAPRVPDIPGLETFQGTYFHSARWRHDVPLAGKRVAVVGTGASAIQIVPAIQPVVQELKVLQRTPAWIIPRSDTVVPEWQQGMYRRFPFTQRLSRYWQYWSREMLVPGLVYSEWLGKWVERWARRHLSHQVRDAALRHALRPQYRVGCKRILLSNDFYPALQQPNTELITAELKGVNETGIITSTGRHIPLDVIVFATGFRVTDHPLAERLHGVHGRTLSQAWHNGAETWLGITVPEFPNLFLLSGPNSGIGHTSLVFMIESQIRYTMQALQWAAQAGKKILRVRQEPCRQFTAEIQERSRRTTWGSGTCASWYLDHAGRNTTVWPGFTFEYWWRTRTFRASIYDVS